MFFITPGCTTPASNDLERGSSKSLSQEHCNKRKRTDSELEHEDTQEREDNADTQRRRIARACDRCRLKKTKCSGGKICNRCKQDRVICVTTPLPKKKGDIHHHPEYTHLVETQRDQLARALYQLIGTQGSADSGNAQALLAEMGITTDSIRQPGQSQSSVALKDCGFNRSRAQTDRVVSPNTSQLWDDMFNDLSGSQIEAIESFGVAYPQLQSFLTTQLPLRPPYDEESEFDSAFIRGGQHIASSPYDEESEFDSAFIRGGQHIASSSTEEAITYHAFVPPSHAGFGIEMGFDNLSHPQQGAVDPKSLIMSQSINTN